MVNERDIWPLSMAITASVLLIALVGAGVWLVGGMVPSIVACLLAACGLHFLMAARRARREARMMNDFMANLFHEFKTPLTTIGICAELLGDGGLDEAERRRATAAILHEASRLKQQMQTMLDLGRIEAGEREYHPEEFDLAALLRNMGGFLKNRFLAPPVIAEGRCDVFADCDAVDQIFVNLFDNAVKYSGSKPLDVSFGPGSRPGLKAIHVADRGPGLTAEQRAHAFDRFWRSDAPSARAVEGHGLGLSIARGLARGMGGDLSVAPRDGGGCVFTLELPAHAPAGMKGGPTHG